MEELAIAPTKLRSSPGSFHRETRVIMGVSIQSAVALPSLWPPLWPPLWRPLELGLGTTSNFQSGSSKQTTSAPPDVSSQPVTVQDAFAASAASEPSVSTMYSDQLPITA